ncbi:hypothetical protein D9619_008677 [Psilocybe cf. subviscida]|uniref:GPN-loop GTPase 1 n=1 Tax=Psilocybe cf. subviscida TaxID=2480587 RepID=A0A8H5BBG7_9AGAR|nr:hypothetical protein D9619_008677 [Psilocybe cf. subviscida]
MIIWGKATAGMMSACAPLMFHRQPTPMSYITSCSSLSPQPFDRTRSFGGSMDGITLLLAQSERSRYLGAAGLALTLYDHTLTLSDEIEYVWKAKWTIPKLLFLLIRYAVPCALILQTYQLAASRRTETMDRTSSYYAFGLCGTEAAGSFCTRSLSSSPRKSQFSAVQSLYSSGSLGHLLRYLTEDQFIFILLHMGINKCDRLAPYSGPSEEQQQKTIIDIRSSRYWAYFCSSNRNAPPMSPLNPSFLRIIIYRTRQPMSAESSTLPSSAADGAAKKKPMAIITIGMAGAGKSTFVSRLNSYLHSLEPPSPPYILNLDPAMTYVPYEPNIDIRDTINYQEVMKQFVASGLHCVVRVLSSPQGPNGGILTALNLFTTKFDQVLSLVEQRAETVDYVVLDTPGQIEIFTWSASGAIITDALASTLPTVVAYIIDTPRTTAPATFMSNMLYACSILYKTKLPFILVFNKTDAQPHEFALEWMHDFELFQAALNQEHDMEGEPTYMNSLMNSMSLVLDEFYKNLKAVGVSSATGDGFKEFLEAVEGSREEYEKEYLPDLMKAREQREKTLKRAQDEAKADSMTRVMRDLEIDRARNPAGALADRWDPNAEDEYNGDDDEDTELNIIDRSDERGPGEYIDITRMQGHGAENMSWQRPG